jgi:hypothetical protein
MPKLHRGGAAILFLIAAGVAVLSTLGLTAASSAASQSASVALVALDTDASGNGPRTVDAIDDCVSAPVDQPVDIDIVIPSPGVPADRGIAAYQFSIMYDPAVVWIAADDSDMLLAQAAGSNVIAIADPKPDSNAVYQSWGVDFGTSGIEPAGSSETGPGVIARITLLPQSDGVSPLTLSNVLLIDDASERLSLEPVQSGSVYVGQPCPVQSDTGTPTPTPAPSPTPTPTPTLAPTPTPAPAPTSTPEPHSPVPAGGAATGVGSLAPAASSFPIWAAFMSTLGGAGLLIASRLAFRGRPRNPTLPLHRKAPHSPDSDVGEL